MHEAPMSTCEGRERLLPEKERRRSAALRRQMRRRAVVDGAVMLLVSGLVCSFATSELELLMLGMACLSVGILLYVMRRSRDLVTLARQDRWREQAVQGRGVSLSAWHGGARLPAWPERQREAA